MEIQRALDDLEEVRGRLADMQRFEGYSGPAAVVSGAGALVAGYAQLRVAALPATTGGMHSYVIIWLSCLAVALLLNYGAVVVWMLKNRRPGARSQFRSAANSIAPTIALGGLLSVALIDHSAFALLPGTWFALYAIGLFASRNVIPDSALGVAAAFAVLAVVFLITPLAAVAMSWWVMPIGFGLGQIAIGAFVWKGKTS